MRRVILLWAAGTMAIWGILGASAARNFVVQPWFGPFLAPWLLLFLHPLVAYGVLIVGSLLVGGAAYYTLGAHQKSSPLRVAARVLGFMGGAMCLAFLMLFGVPVVLGFFHGLGFYGELQLLCFLAVATTAPVMAIGGAGLALKKRKAAGILMLASGIVAWAPTCMTLFLGWDFVIFQEPPNGDLLGPPFLALFVGLHYIFVSFFLIPGGILALIAREK